MILLAMMSKSLSATTTCQLFDRWNTGYVVRPPSSNIFEDQQHSHSKYSKSGTIAVASYCWAIGPAFKMTGYADAAGLR